MQTTVSELLTAKNEIHGKLNSVQGISIDLFCPSWFCPHCSVGNLGYGVITARQTGLPSALPAAARTRCRKKPEQKHEAVLQGAKSWVSLETPGQREDKAVILPEMTRGAPRGKSHAWSEEWQTGAEGWSKITVGC